MLKFLCVGIPDNWISLEKLVSIDQHIIKIHGVVLDQTLLVKHVQAFDLLFTKVSGGIVLRTDQIVLGS